VKLLRISLLYALILVAAITLLPAPLASTFVGYLGFLLTPGIWVVYDHFDVNNHDILPLLAAELVNILLYWIIFALFLGLRRKIRIAPGGRNDRRR